MRDTSLFYYGRKRVDKSWHIEYTIGVNRLYYIHHTNISVMVNGEVIPLREKCIYLFPQNIKFDPVFCEGMYLDHTFFDFLVIPPFYLDSVVEIPVEDDRLLRIAADAAFAFAEGFPTYESTEYNNRRELVKRYFLNLLAVITEKYKLKTISDERINGTIDYIHKNVCEHISVEALSALAYMEKNYYIRTFKKYVGSTPYKYIINCRMNLAVSLIKQGKSVTDAALFVGYASVSAFSNAIKKEYGVYPSALQAHL